MNIRYISFYAPDSLDEYIILYSKKSKILVDKKLSFHLIKNENDNANTFQELLINLVLHQYRSYVFCKISNSLENSVKSRVQPRAVRDSVFYEEEH